MHFRYLILLLTFLPLLSGGCKQQNSNTRISEKFDIQGHRGCRGLMPENSIHGFINATSLGATTLEMDVVITKDNYVILSHEPYMSYTICLDSLGNSISQAEEKNHNIYQMNYSDVIKYDCGSSGHPDFQEQNKMDSRKPRLISVIQAVESFVRTKGLPPVHYNIETKCSDLGDNVYHPSPKAFVHLLMKVINETGIADRTIIQSFDPRTLNEVHDLNPDIRTALLVTNQLGYRHNLQRLDHTPTIFSPNKIFLTDGMIKFMHNEGIQVIPWTVNDSTKMEELIEMGVDGIITDYPDRLKKLIWDLGI